MASRARSSTIIGTGTLPPGSSQPGPPSIDISAASYRNITESSLSAAANALHTLNNSAGPSRPRFQIPGGHTRGPSWHDPTPAAVASVPSAPAVPTRGSLDRDALISGSDTFRLTLHTYKLSASSASTTATAQPSPLPSGHFVPSTAPPSHVLFNHLSVPLTVRAGDYLEIHRIRRPGGKNDAKRRGMGGDASHGRTKGEASKGVAKGSGRSGYVFRVGEDTPNVPLGQIQVPESVAVAFDFQHRQEVEISRVSQTCRAESNLTDM